MNNEAKWSAELTAEGDDKNKPNQGQEKTRERGRQAKSQREARRLGRKRQTQDTGAKNREVRAWVRQGKAKTSRDKKIEEIESKK